MNAVKTKKQKTKIVFINSSSELLRKVRYARRGTIYVLVDDSVGVPLSRSELMEELEYLQNFIILQRHLGVKTKPAIVVMKR